MLFPTGPGYYSLMDQLHGRYVEKAPPLPYGLFAMVPPSFFDLDFRYLEDPKYTDFGLFDPLKRIHCCDDWMLSVFSQTWSRTMIERNVDFTRLDNDHNLFRTRLAGDLWYRDQFRFFAEYIYAERSGFGNDDFGARAIDINRSDLQNLFVDVKLGEWCEGPVYVRVGRQELLLGSQRLISTLDWANVRRKFDGVRGFWIGKEWTVDAFWVQPVLVNRNDWDNVDNNRHFFGIWASRKPGERPGLDLYWLYLDDTNPIHTGRDGVRGGWYVHTLGGRVFGNWNNWVYEIEPMFQVGTYSNQDLLAASVPFGGGYQWKQHAWLPQIMLYYEWATGDRNPGQGDLNTSFNQLYPFGHYYFGFLDLVSRRNIHDVVLQFTCWPENWLTCLVQVHNFWLYSSDDALYNAAGAPIRRDPTGQAGNYVGTELDLFFVAQVSRYANVSVGYSRMFNGEFIRQTGPDVTPSLLYFIFSYRW
ncbi:MAG: alginate export family protein [Gemmatales bacterium]|nr:alginate export family protein [Gemmatales bacterium]MDW8388465.1 alginate export family protein [Gemmatales bacterium]